MIVPRIGTNIAANFLGAAWLGALTLILVPLQIRLLGVEAYGLVGLITVLQVATGALDMGLSATITRAIASDQDPNRSYAAGLSRAMSAVYWGIALSIAVVLWALADYLADHWLRGSQLSPHQVKVGIELIAIYIALRWPVSFYAGILSGLARLDILNMLKAGAASVRMLGGVAVLLVAPRIELFLGWYVASAALETLATMLAARWLAPGLVRRPRFELAPLRSEWRFSVVMNLIAIIAVVLTQTDRLLVGRMLGLEALGYYALAYNIAMALSLIQMAINSASFPVYAAAWGGGLLEALQARAEKMGMLIVATTALPTAMLLFYGKDILRIWMNVSVAEAAWLPMAILAGGFYLNAAVSNAHQVAVACGKPQITLKVNLWSLVFYLPALVWATSTWGIKGAALCWLGLNVFYLMALLPPIHRLLFRESAYRWISAALLPYTLLALILIGTPRALAYLWDAESGAQLFLFLLVGVAGYVSFAYWRFPPVLRQDIRNFLSRFIGVKA